MSEEKRQWWHYLQPGDKIKVDPRSPRESGWLKVRDTMEFDEEGVICDGDRIGVLNAKNERLMVYVRMITHIQRNNLTYTPIQFVRMEVKDYYHVSRETCQACRDLEALQARVKVLRSFIVGLARRHDPKYTDEELICYAADYIEDLRKKVAACAENPPATPPS